MIKQLTADKTSAYRYSKWIFVLPIVLGLMSLTNLISRAFIDIPFPYSFNYGEPGLLMTIRNLSHHPLVYRDLTLAPYLLTPYNPLYFYVCFLTSLVTGQSYMCGRIVSFVSCLAVIYFLYRLIRQENTPRPFAFTWACLFASVPTVFCYTTTMKSDFFALALSAAGMWCLIKRENSPNLKIDGSFFIALFILLLSYWTKQSYLNVPAAFFVYLCISKRFSEALVFSFIFALGIVIPFTALNIATQGAFWTNQEMVFRNAYFIKGILLYWSPYFFEIWPVLLIAALGILLALRGKLAVFPIVYLLINLCMTSAVGKTGAGSNYFLEFSFALFWTTGLVLSRLQAISTGLRWGLLLFSIPVVFSTITLSNSLAALPQSAAHLKKMASDLGPLVGIIKKAKGRVLAENMSLLIAADKPIEYQPYEFTQLSQCGLWDENLILTLLDRSEFELIVLNTSYLAVIQTSRFSANFLIHLRTHYKIFGTTHGEIVYVPRATYPGQTPMERAIGRNL